MQIESHYNDETYERMEGGNPQAIYVNKLHAQEQADKLNVKWLRKAWDEELSAHLGYEADMSLFSIVGAAKPKNDWEIPDLPKGVTDEQLLDFASKANVTQFYVVGVDMK